MKLTLAQAAKMIDHTNLHADASTDAIRALCREAADHGFAMVAVNQVQSASCAAVLEGTGVGVGAAISFPLGQTTVASKVSDTCDAIAHGATEIDYVVNLTAVKDGDWAYVEDEMRRIVDACARAEVVSKVIFENCYLTDDEKVRLCEVANAVGPDFVKTSTGMAEGGATLADVRLMRAHCLPSVKVKAAGGIRDAETFLAMVEAGADRIGTSAGIAIIEELRGLLAAESKDAFVIDR